VALGVDELEGFVAEDVVAVAEPPLTVRLELTQLELPTRGVGESSR
jgi:hypothetical protein